MGDNEPPQSVPDADTTISAADIELTKPRRQSSSQQSQESQTAAEFLRDQMQMEADAREAMPYSIENCTKPLGALRQNVFACLTCNPPPATPDGPFEPAGVCYSCSVQCHGEHELVEIFQKRNFTCDCGTTRLPAGQSCTLRLDPKTNQKGVHSETPDPNNKYNQNFRNRFCSCSVDYNPNEQKGTMFQCLGLGDADRGGCGEDWYHPGCLVGQGPKWYEKMVSTKDKNAPLQSISEDGPEPQPEAAEALDNDDNDAPLPEGFPDEEDFDHLICWKCTEAFSWIKAYAGESGFLDPVYHKKTAPGESESESESKKRKADDALEEESPEDAKRIKTDPDTIATTSSALGGSPSEGTTVDVKVEAVKEEDRSASCKHPRKPFAIGDQFSLFTKPEFRDRLCHCESCFPKLKVHPQLLEEEDAYEPPLSESGSENGGGSTHGSGSIYDRGESALKNVDRVRAIEGVMAYNHLKDKLTPFFKQFAESGQAISAEDIKGYFAKLRGDEQGIKEAGDAAAANNGDGHRDEQPGY